MPASEPGALHPLPALTPVARMHFLLRHCRASGALGEQQGVCAPGAAWREAKGCAPCRAHAPPPPPPAASQPAVCRHLGARHASVRNACLAPILCVNDEGFCFRDAPPVSQHCWERRPEGRDAIGDGCCGQGRATRQMAEVGWPQLRRSPTQNGPSARARPTLSTGYPSAHPSTYPSTHPPARPPTHPPEQQQSGASPSLHTRSDSLALTCTLHTARSLFRTTVG